MEEKYTWAINQIKLQQSIAKAPAMFGPKFTEDNVKEIYISLGGLLANGETVEPLSEPNPTPIMENEEEVVVPVEETVEPTVEDEEKKSVDEVSEDSSDTVEDTSANIE